MRVVATAGHVDHGKSALVQALTGVHPDRWEEEKRRGLTIDLGFAHTTLPSGEELSIVDVPGHVRFLRNMLAGVGGVDACIFVVAATEGWKPQSEEHLRILEMVGVTHGVIAMTKSDLVDDDWRSLQEMDIRDRVAGTFLEDEPIVAVSSTSGEGLEALRSELEALVHRSPSAADRGRPRLWIDRVFAAKGSGTVVTGTLTGGVLRSDQVVTVLGERPHEARVRGIQVHGAKVDSVGPGHRVALNLAGVEHQQLRRGDAVVDPAQWRATTRLDASLTVLAALDHRVSRRGAYTLHAGSGEHPARLRVLGPESIAPGETGHVRLHVTTPLPLVRGDRFVLRESGRDETVGGGVVLDVAPVRPASKATPDMSVDRVVAEHGWLTADDLWALTDERRAPSIGPWVVDPAARTVVEERLRALVTGADPALGLDVAALDERQRALLPLLEGVSVVDGRARPAEVRDPLA
ncbi:MAG: selenocysteine-specific elongation factor, partial [Actinomycetota bacterium]